MDKNAKIIIGIAITIVVVILAVVCICVAMNAQSEAKYPGISEEEFIGTYFCKSPGGRADPSYLTINPDHTFEEKTYHLTGTWEKSQGYKTIFEGVDSRGARFTFSVHLENRNMMDMSFVSTKGSEYWKYTKQS